MSDEKKTNAVLELAFAIKHTADSIQNLLSSYYATELTEEHKALLTKLITSMTHRFSLAMQVDVGEKSSAEGSDAVH